ncbi:MAG: RnfABCDGE type electron transport complex subunit B [Clostridium sp.]|jgi:Na+-translocating ferredoxin:NAD+ oxidoreductase RNF subunit RnfB|nr:RnfABCDGE type electron transport complex subunit B [Clostridium sp.]
MGILTAATIVAVTGIFMGVFLGIAGLVFYVKGNPKEEAVLAALPGNNCGGCGFPGCNGLAAAIVEGKVAIDACPVGGDDVAQRIGEILGETAQKQVRKVAYIHCAGCADMTTDLYEYCGVTDCQMMQFVPAGGAKACPNGCLGYGSCQKVCAFDAIQIVGNIAVVIKEKCKSCGRCVESCPRNLIELIPDKPVAVIACASTQKGALTQKACQVGCIGCGICVKNCPVKAITIEQFHAVIQEETCTACGVCVEKCPKNCIHLRGSIEEPHETTG